MFVSSVLLLMVVCPVLSLCAEHFIFHSSAPMMLLVGKWFVFWSGVRLCGAGLRQFFQPQFTAEKIFGMASSGEPLPFIRELGIANIATGTVGVLSLFKPTFVFPMAITAAIFYGLAGTRHLTDAHRTQKQNIVMMTDIFVALVLIVFVGSVVFGSAVR